MKTLAGMLAVAAGLALATSGAAQQAASTPSAATASSLSNSLGAVVFPAKGQVADVQGRDEGECHTWSKDQTGIDPLALAPAPATPPAASTTVSSRAGGERVRGAARGAAAAQQQAASQPQRDQFNKGFAACLEAKGYTVK